MRIIVLGAAAGGGFPQWNCNCGPCRRARSGDPLASPRTQSSLAVSADGGQWVLLNASPDLRQQMLATPALHPREGLRHSPIGAALLTNGDVDHVAGLINLREGHRFTLYASDDIHDVLRANSLFGVLNHELVERCRMPLDVAQPIMGGQGPTGLTIRMFPVPGKVALYLEGAAPELAAVGGHTVGLEVSDGTSSFFYIPGCAEVSEELAGRIAGAPLVFFDGTVWHDEEMRDAGVGTKTGRRMGHLPISGPDGSMAAFERLGIARKIYIHINNTNPILLEDSPQYAAVRAAGWEVARDGMEVTP